MKIRATLLALSLLGCNRTETRPPPRRPVTPPVAQPVAVVDAGPPAPEPSPANSNVGFDAGFNELSQRPAVLIVRLKNDGPIPLRLRTNPDLNEFLVTKRSNAPATASDRAAFTAEGTRVSLFPVGQMPLCDARDGGAGYGGLGLQGEIVLAPGETRELGRWDGIRREEVNDPTRGVCLRESPLGPGRYRMQLDQPQLEGRPACTKAMFAWPPTRDAGVLTLEIQCRAALPDGGIAGGRPPQSCCGG
jgi:hypothetical protein